MVSFKKRFTCVVAAAAVMVVTGRVPGAVIEPVDSVDIPVSDSSSVFDSGNAGNIYGLEPGTAFIPEGFDIRDLFGGSFGTVADGPWDVIFENYQAQGTISSVDVSLAAPVSLTNFHLFLADDGPDGNRSASEFKLFAGGKLVDDVPLLDASGNKSYDGVYGSNCIDVTDTLAGLPATTDYLLEFVQNQTARPSSGVRAVEFEATGDSPTVPEPTSLTCMIVSGIALCARRRRIYCGSSHPPPTRRCGRDANEVVRTLARASVLAFRVVRFSMTLGCAPHTYSRTARRSRSIQKTIYHPRQCCRSAGIEGPQPGASGVGHLWTALNTSQGIGSPTPLRASRSVHSHIHHARRARSQSPSAMTAGLFRRLQHPERKNYRGELPTASAYHSRWIGSTQFDAPYVSSVNAWGAGRSLRHLSRTDNSNPKRFQLHPDIALKWR